MFKTIRDEIEAVGVGSCPLAGDRLSANNSRQRAPIRSQFAADFLLVLLMLLLLLLRVCLRVKQRSITQHRPHRETINKLGRRRRRMQTTARAAAAAAAGSKFRCGRLCSTGRLRSFVRVCDCVRALSAATAQTPQIQSQPHTTGEDAARAQ